MQIRKLSATLIILLGTNFSAQVSATSASDAYNSYKQADAAGEIQQALAFAKQAVVLGEQQYAQHADALLRLKYNLAVAYVQAGQPDQAEAISNEISELTASLYDELTERPLTLAFSLHSQLYAHYKTAGDIYAQRRFEKQLTAVLETLPESTFGTAEMTAQTYAEVARALTAYAPELALSSAGQAVIAKAVSTTSQAWGEQDARTVEMAYLKGRLQFALQDYQASTQTLTQVVDALDGTLAYTHPWALQAHVLLADAFDNTGQTDKARMHNQKVAAMIPWQDELAPQLLLSKAPEIPRAAAKHAKATKVMIQFDINAAGQVINARAIDESASGHFTDSALAAISQWRYAPRVANGKVVETKDQIVSLYFEGGRYRSDDLSSFPGRQNERQFAIDKRETLVTHSNQRARTVSRQVYGY